MGESTVQIQVQCYSGYRGEQTPRRIRLASGDIEVKQILDRWLAPDHRYFKILGADDAVYIIRHESASWQWELTFFRQAHFKPIPANHHGNHRIH